MRLMIVLFALLLLAGCATNDSLEDRVPRVPGEVLYDDVLIQQLPSTDIRVLGVGLGTTEADVLSLHGEADIANDYNFGRVRNLEYSFGQNGTAVLYHLDQGVVTSILLTQEANSFLVNETVMDHSLAELYGLLGIPTLARDRHLERVFYYDELGYEVYLVKKRVDRIYLTAPDRGIKPVGTVVNGSDTLCAQVITPAQDPVSGACEEFPTPCDVPEGWAAVDGCGPEDDRRDNAAPSLCIQVITSAIDPDSGVCEEFPTPCDVPEGWERVDAC